ncbi:MAG: hypothetical protein CM15mP106_8210 [Candidatus Neomarinimicrobiota bacterium]|nr:MAG: hypothetical protein CM15mP106_8210 [Candidatus Neomarinimicrobiota bacterium]
MYVNYKKNRKKSDKAQRDDYKSQIREINDLVRNVRHTISEKRKREKSRT